MAPTFLSWSTPRLSILAACIVVAAAFTIDAIYFHPQHRGQSPIGAANEGDRTFCYDGVGIASGVAFTARTGLSGREACFEVQGGRFSSVGKIVPKGDGTGSREVERRRGYVLPGLWDGHGHLLAYGEFLHSVDLFRSEGIEEVRERLARFLEGNGEDVGGRGRWVRGVSSSIFLFLSAVRR